jgi:hypothetical protein
MMEVAVKSTDIGRFLRIGLIVMWVLTTVLMIVLIMAGVRDTHRFVAVHYIIPGIYVLVLVWYLLRTGTPMEQLPEIPSPVLPKWRFGSLIPVFLITLIFLSHFLSDSGGSILILLLMIGTGWILVSWRREITLRMLVTGCALAIVALLGGWLYLDHGFISSTVFLLFLILVPPMFMAGGLLIKHTGFGYAQLLTGSYGKAVKSFLYGCLLFVPLGLTNAASGSPGTDFAWLTRWWMPFSLPWYSGIVEEVFYRQMLVGLCYFMVRPAFRKYPAVAALSAVLFSGIVFGLQHGRTVHNFLTTGLLYGFPMAVVFAHRDLEHAIGFHYTVNFLPVLMVFLKI